MMAKGQFPSRSCCAVRSPRRRGCAPVAPRPKARGVTRPGAPAPAAQRQPARVERAKSLRVCGGRFSLRRENATRSKAAGDLAARLRARGAVPAGGQPASGRLGRGSLPHPLAAFGVVVCQCSRVWRSAGYGCRGSRTSRRRYARTPAASISLCPVLWNEKGTSLGERFKKD